MPGVDKYNCTGCETCIESCPVDTISIINDIAEIDIENCINCGIKVDHALVNDNKKLKK